MQLLLECGQRLWLADAMSKPRYRLAIDQPLAQGIAMRLEGNQAHYLMNVLRLKIGDTVSLFNRTDGEYSAEIQEVSKRLVLVAIAAQSRPPEQPVGLTVCFAPIKGGRLETIIEKATELGANILQPVITARTIVGKVNLERAQAIAREAAEQCERTGWPEIREPVKLLSLLGNWPSDRPLIYGDESGVSGSITELVPPPLQSAASAVAAPTAMTGWGILVGPEGGFTPEELAALTRVSAAKGVGLGPRILRADTAVITLCALTLAAWGDWHLAPRFGA